MKQWCHCCRISCSFWWFFGWWLTQDQKLLVILSVRSYMIWQEKKSYIWEGITHIKQEKLKRRNYEMGEPIDWGGWTGHNCSNKTSDRQLHSFIKTNVIAKKIYINKEDGFSSDNGSLDTLIFVRGVSVHIQLFLLPRLKKAT